MRVLLLSIALIISTNSNAQITPKYIHKNSTEISKNLFMSACEVSNMQYKVFNEFVKSAGNQEQIDIVSIDTLNWINNNFYNSPYVNHYYSHNAYKQYPVVNVSYNAALLYCRWLTDNYNNSSKKKYKQVVFRLPTKDEWVIAVKSENPENIYPWSGNSVFNENGTCRANFKREQQKTEIKSGELHDNADVLAPVFAYWPNKSGLYNLSGNAAEMLADQSGTAGGSYMNTKDYLSVNAKDPFEGLFSNPDSSHQAVGFRWVMEVIEE